MAMANIEIGSELGVKTAANSVTPTIAPRRRHFPRILPVRMAPS